MTGQAGQAAGVVKVRLSGDLADVEVVAEILAGYPGAGAEVLDRSAPYPNRRDPGARVYLTLRIGEPEGHGGPGPGPHGRNCGCPYCPPPGVTP